MRELLSTAAVVLLLGIANPTWVSAQDDIDATVLTPESMVFQPYGGEAGARMAVLYGDPRAEGHFVIRLEFPPNWAGRPHEHGGAELLLALSGACYVAHGEDLTREAATPLPPGSFAAVEGGTAMRGFSGDEGCVVTVQGQGPFTTTFLDETGGSDN